MRDTFVKDIQAGIEAVRNWPQQTVQVFHHNDSDGISSGAILTRAFEREGLTVRRFSLEKPYPALLGKIFEQQGGFIVFADFAARIAPLISSFNQGRNLTLILDHHVAEPSTDPLVHNLAPTLHGMKGDRDISGSTTCYRFAEALNPANRDLAHLAVVGAVGDEFFVNGCLAGENREVATLAVNQGTLEISGATTGERYVLRTPSGPIACDAFAADLDTLGAAGFYQNGPEMGVGLCLEGRSAESDEWVARLRRVQKKAFDTELERLKRGGFKQTANLQWFHVENRFAPMGVKMIGVFLDAIKNTGLIDPNRYVAGFQLIPDEIPGFGPVGMDDVKISMRVADPLADEIRSGKRLGLDVLLPSATNKLGGFSDACHTLTAATTVTRGRETALIQAMEDDLAALT